MERLNGADLFDKLRCYTHDVDGINPIALRQLTATFSYKF